MSSQRLSAVLLVLAITASTTAHAENEVLPAPAAEDVVSVPSMAPCVPSCGCDVCCDGDWRCCRPSKWRHLRTWLGKGCCCTTGTLYPHYPYFPERHGYYAFAPYNWRVLNVQKQLAPQFGEPEWNPFSKVPYKDIYADLPNTWYPNEESTNIVPRLGRVDAALPDLEAVLAGSHEAPAPPAPEVPAPDEAPADE